MSQAFVDLDPLSLPLDGLRLIEASAGTGKTYTIAALYLRLVLGHEPGRGAAEAEAQALMPPDILVLTFTEAAARELRDRIRQRLAGAAEAFRLGEAGDDAILAGLLADHADEDRRRHAAFRLEQAVQWLDEAAISTIHAWCLRVLRQHAFDSGSLFSQELLQDLAPLRDEVVRDVWRRWFYPLPAARAAVVAELFGGPRELGAELLPLLAAPERPLAQDGRPVSADSDAAWHAWQQAADAQQAAQTAVREGWLRDQAAIMALLREALPQLKGNVYKDSWLSRFPAAMADWLAGGAEPDKLEKLAQDALRKDTKKGCTTPGHVWFEQVESWCAASAQRRAARDTLRLGLLAGLRVAVREGLDAELRHRGALGFDELLRQLDSALRGPGGARLAARLRERFPVALIDEFQDTDPVQFRIFQALYAVPEAVPAARALLLIGDPKQAIYSFRGADLPTYLQARALARPPHHTLGRNFRSDAALVEGVNALLNHAEQRWPGGVFGGSGDSHLGFQPVRARGRGERLMRRDAAGLRAEPPLQLALPASPARIGNKDTARRWLADAAAATLLDWLRAAGRGELGFVDTVADPQGRQLRPLTPGDIAVLVRDRHEASALRRALARRGIPSVYGSDRDSVLASAEAAQLQCWLEACERPDDEARLRLALATPALGLSWQQLDALGRDEQRWEDEIERLRRFQAIWRGQGVLAAVRAWLFHYRVPARLLHPDCPDGERALTNFLHLAELLEQAAVGLHGEHALIRHLAEAREEAGQQVRDDALVRLESDDARVRVVTLHQSKGLEYQVVCLPFTALPPGEPRTPLRCHLDGQGVFDLSEDKDGIAMQAARAERLAEDLRLFYVGITRACSLLWLALAPVGGKDAALAGTPWLRLLTGDERLPDAALPDAIAGFCTALPELHRRVLPEPAEDGPVERWRPARAGAPLLPARALPPASGASWWIASYSALGHAEVAHTLREPASASAERFAEQTLLQLAELPRGAEIGTFWHDLLEWCAHQGFADSLADPARVDAEVAARCAARGWEAQCAALQQALRHWLATPLRLPGCRQPVRLGELRRYQPELEFWFAASDLDARRLDALVSRHALPGLARPALEPLHLNGLFKGFMDLVFEHEGRYFVADYKSNHLGEDSAAYLPEALATAILAHRYDLQYCLYLLALHRHLRVRLADYDYDRHIGGAVYLFLRGWDDSGRGVHLERPPRALIDAMDAAFAARPEVPA